MIPSPRDRPPARRRRLRAVAAAAACAAGACAAAADTVVADDGEHAGVAVLRVEETLVAWRAPGAEAPVETPRAAVRAIRFDRGPVAAKPAGVVLRDGTRLNGLAGTWADPLPFRSTTLGPLALPAAELAVLYYDPEALVPERLDRLPGPFVEDRLRNVYDGKLLWADARSAGVRTARGIERIGAAALAFVRLAAFERRTACVLRNGDVLNRVTGWGGDRLTASVAGGAHEVPLAAVRELHFR